MAKKSLEKNTQMMCRNYQRSEVDAVALTHLQVKSFVLIILATVSEGLRYCNHRKFRT